jgi:ABC-2 type transport system ATP-binding protein
MSASSLAIEVEGLRKSFRIPHPEKKKGLPFGPGRYKRIQLFDGIDFDVAHGEFFGVVGRNGSGKSTLLKLVAGIFRPDAGRVEVNGKIAPVLDLGVGFDRALPVRENAIIYGVMLGLSPREARKRTDAIIDFAELHDHTEAQLKHLSSGMRVRLAFSTMLASDPDVLLIDEVLTVGDRGFREKSAEAMADLRAKGKTIVLVTHSMDTIERLCSRAMLLEGGKIAKIGDPGEVTAAYLEVNLDRDEDGPDPAEDPRLGEPRAVIKSAILVDEGGAQRSAAEPEETLEIAAELEVTRPIRRPTLRVMIRTDRRRAVIAIPAIHILEGEDATLNPGDDPFLRLRLENRLRPGNYIAELEVRRAARRVEGLPASKKYALPFSISGDRAAGRRHHIAVRHDLSVETNGDKPQRRPRRRPRARRARVR